MDLTALRNFKDFLLLYNQISETCFRRCAGSTITRELSTEENTCVDSCVGKYVNANHRIMGVYMEVQSALVNKKIQQYNEAETATQVQTAESETGAQVQMVESEAVAQAQTVEQ